MTRFARSSSLGYSQRRRRARRATGDRRRWERNERGRTDSERIGQDPRIDRVQAARRTVTFTESVIREMTRIATMHQAVNLAQGFPDFPMPELMKEAACTAIRGDINQYAVTWGTPVLRQAIAEKYRRWYDMEVDPDLERHGDVRRDRGDGVGVHGAA